MQEVVIHLVMNNIIYVISLIVYLNVLFKKKRIIKWEQAPADTRNGIKKHEKKINCVLKIIVGMGMIFGLFYFLIPFAMDIGNIKNENYVIVEGEVESWDYSDEKEIKERGVEILSNKTGENIFVVVYDTGIRKGDYLRVRYLPHTKRGEILYRNPILSGGFHTNVITFILNKPVVKPLNIRMEEG